MIIYTNKVYCDKVKAKVPYGYVAQNIINYNDNINMWKHNLDEPAPFNKSDLQLHLFVPQQDMMQYFMQWQRYRKFWWSSITTTPSLFVIDEIKNENEALKVKINAEFPFGSHTVEHVKITPLNSIAHLSCSLQIENGMLTLLLDATNETKDYLRIHRKMAPYKLSYAIDSGENKIHQELKLLAKQLNHRLQCQKICNNLPLFELSFDDQIKENLLMGVTYTAILSERTLLDGIFHLYDSNTRLKEQVHIADFDSYAYLICNK